MVWRRSSSLPDIKQRSRHGERGAIVVADVCSMRMRYCLVSSTRTHDRRGPCTFPAAGATSDLQTVGKSASENGNVSPWEPPLTKVSARFPFHISDPPKFPLVARHVSAPRCRALAQDAGVCDELTHKAAHFTTGAGAVSRDLPYETDCCVAFYFTRYSPKQAHIQLAPAQCD